MGDWKPFDLNKDEPLPYCITSDNNPSIARFVLKSDRDIAIKCHNAPDVEIDWRDLDIRLEETEGGFLVKINEQDTHVFSGIGTHKAYQDLESKFDFVDKMFRALQEENDKLKSQIASMDALVEAVENAISGAMAQEGMPDTVSIHGKDYDAVHKAFAELRAAKGGKCSDTVALDALVGTVKDLLKDAVLNPKFDKLKQALAAYQAGK